MSPMGLRKLLYFGKNNTIHWRIIRLRLATLDMSAFSIPRVCVLVYIYTGFHTVCLDRWVLQSAWLCYKQQYGNVNVYKGVKYLTFLTLKQ